MQGRRRIVPAHTCVVKLNKVTDQTIICADQYLPLMASARPRVSGILHTDNLARAAGSSGWPVEGNLHSYPPSTYEHTECAKPLDRHVVGGHAGQKQQLQEYCMQRTVPISHQISTCGCRAAPAGCVVEAGMARRIAVGTRDEVGGTGNRHFLLLTFVCDACKPIIPHQHTVAVSS